MGLLGAVATALGCATGATRVVTDAGWAPFARQIGTTGAVVDPELYLAFGISGAVQHVSGIGQPRDVVSVNLDASAPMMAMADLALVTDAVALTKSWPSGSVSRFPPARSSMPEQFDVVVVGAGPAGSAAALVAARGDLSVCLLERGPLPGFEEHVWRRDLRAHPRRPHPALVGRGPGATLDHPALHHGSPLRPKR